MRAGSAVPSSPGVRGSAAPPVPRWAPGVLLAALAYLLPLAAAALAAPSGGGDHLPGLVAARARGVEPDAMPAGLRSGRVVRPALALPQERVAPPTAPAARRGSASTESHRAADTPAPRLDASRGPPRA